MFEDQIRVLSHQQGQRRTSVFTLQLLAASSLGFFKSCSLNI